MHGGNQAYARQIDEDELEFDGEEASTGIKDLNNDSLIGSQASRNARLQMMHFENDRIFDDIDAYKYVP